MSFVRKITVKNIVGAVKDYVPSEKEAPVMLVRVVGSVSRLAHGTSNFGGEESPWVKFLGQFKAVNLLTGEEFRAFTCLLPSIASEPLEAAVAEADAPVEFAFDLGVRWSDTPIGYEYVCNPLIEPDTADPLEQLTARLPAPEIGATQAESKGKKGAAKSRNTAA